MQLNKTGKQIYEQFLLLVATTKITGTRSEPVNLGPIYSLIMKLPPTSLPLLQNKEKAKTNKTKNQQQQKKTPPEYFIRNQNNASGVKNPQRCTAYGQRIWTFMLESKLNSLSSSVSPLTPV